ACYVGCFFFSSRRRHTRSKRDWSSDVCSSDLKFVSHAAPAVVFLQYGAREKFLNSERARLYAAVVSEPKRLKIYDAEHALNAEARHDRIQFLIEQLKLRPLPDFVIAAIPDLYQPPEPNQ